MSLKLRRSIVDAYRRLDSLGYIVESAGNVSLRTASGMLITPTGATARLSPEDIVEMTLDGEVSGPLRPSSEWGIHAGVYASVSDAGAVVHSHADACVALASLRKPIPAFHYMVAVFGGDSVPCVDYHPFGSEALARATAEALEDRSGCLLANHGMVVRGATLDKAIAAAVLLETLARQYLMALGAGRPAILSRDDMAEVHRRFEDYGRQPGAKGADR